MSKKTLEQVADELVADAIAAFAAIGLSNRIVFKCDEGEFSGLRKAEQWCKEHGYSYGSLQRGAPIGMLKGDALISKWRNMTDKDRVELDGYIEFTNGTARDGDAMIVLSQLAAAAAERGEGQP